MKLAGRILLGAAVLGSLGFCNVAEAACLTLDLKLDNMPDDDGFVALDGAGNMVELTITATGSDQGEVKLSVNDAGATRIKVYDATKTNVLIYDTDKEEKFDPSEDPIVLYVEGVLVSASVDDVVLTLEWTDSGAEEDPDDDIVKITVVEIDLDVDSDNNDGYSDPARTGVEDQKEGALGEPGKILGVNDDDDDEDGVYDFADGFDRDGTPGNDDDSNTDESDFIPMILEISAGVDPNTAKVDFDYSASNPADCGPTEPAAGRLRIWKENGSTARDKRAIGDGGDFVPSDTAISWSLLPNADSDPRVKRLYVEAVREPIIGTDTITTMLLPDGTNEVGWDTVQVRGIVVDLDADTDRDGTVDSDDEDGEDTFSTTKGAIILDNCDDDDPAAPRSKNNSDDEINTAADLDDFTELVLHRTSLHDLDALPTGWKVQLSVPSDQDDDIQIFDKYATDGTRVI
ncbi:MAG: hypothetical protein ACYTF6_13125, partial [Planctomycetota bacterium]